MRFEQYGLVVPVADGPPADLPMSGTNADGVGTDGFTATGAARVLKVGDFRDKTIQFISIVGGLTIEGSMDGTHYHTIGSAVSAGDSIQEIDIDVQWIRLNRSSGTPASDAAIFGGLNARTV